MLATTEINWGFKGCVEANCYEKPACSFPFFFFLLLPIRLNPWEYTELLFAILLRQQQRAFQLCGCGHVNVFFHELEGNAEAPLRCLFSAFLHVSSSLCYCLQTKPWWWREPAGRDQSLGTHAAQSCDWELRWCCGVQVQQLGWNGEEVFCLLWARSSQSSGLCGVWNNICIYV